ncbi:hypothetical protein [Ralstonia mannitolilytica]|uniref:hypothetical protein n=1 Tax=Ralstonia mannitolilytica TaxID=105219 RepID=UPI00292CB403|nr:hypothetical protein [Ralstonia mannitolilytica]
MILVHALLLRGMTRRAICAESNCPARDVVEHALLSRVRQLLALLRADVFKLLLIGRKRIDGSLSLQTHELLGGVGDRGEGRLVVLVVDIRFVLDFLLLLNNVKRIVPGFAKRLADLAFGLGNFPAERVRRDATDLLRRKCAGAEDALRSFKFRQEWHVFLSLRHKAPLFCMP